MGSDAWAFTVWVADVVSANRVGVLWMKVGSSIEIQAEHPR